MKQKVLLIFVIFLSLIILVTIIFARKSSIKQSWMFPSGSSEPSPTTITKPEPKYKAFETSHATSPDGNFVAYFFVNTEKTQELGVKVEGLLAESLVEFPDKPNNEPFYIFREDLTDGNSFLEEKLYHDYRYRSMYSYIDSGAAKRIAWSNDGKMLAVLVPGKIVLAHFLHAPPRTDIFNQGTEREYKRTYKSILQFKNKQDISLPFYTQDYSIGEKIFFSGDDKRIWLGFMRAGKAEDSLFLGKSADEVYLIDLSTLAVKQKRIASITRGNDIYPVPTTSGIVYWTVGKEEINQPSITLDFDSSRNVYLMPEYSIDYPGKILLSPDLKKVCVEYGSSGFWGYLIYELPSMRELGSGEQYSYCVRWIGNDEIIIVDHPFFQQTYYYSFLLNTSTQKKILIDETGDKRDFQRRKLQG